MQSPTGRRFGSYEITGPLGAGGMGEVYRASDTTLGREVALKVLPESFATDPDRLMRFEREARTLAALNHPNIAQIYGVESSGSTRGIVMELVEGPTLAELITPGRGLPMDEALPIALQIITALEAAHDAGIVHRDLKPANIKVRPDGTVKVLDFGIAKALDQGSPSGEQGSAQAASTPTITTPAMTLRGIILGTAAYMSPEQARGRFVDKRADVWSFGCVLFEMLTGKRAFEGDDATDTLAAVVRAEPDWTALPPNLPPAIRLVLQNCLIKDPSKRLAAISTASFLLRSPLEVRASNVQATPPARRGRAVVLGAVAVMIFTAIGASIAWRLKPRPVPQVTRFSVPLADGQEFSGRGGQVMALSPDGTQLAYTANRQLFLRTLSNPDAVVVSGTNLNILQPVFSPDGQSIAFVADRALRKIGVTGGTPVTLCPVEDFDAGISWDGGVILFAQPRGVFSVPAVGGKPDLLVPIKDGERISSPHMLPEGRAVLFAVTTGNSLDRWDRGQVVVHSLATGQRKLLIEGGADPRYLKSGHIAYAVGGVVFAAPFDATRLELLGPPVPVLEGVNRGFGAGVASHFAVSETGTVAYLPGSASLTSGDRTLAVMENDTVRPLGLPRSSYFTPRVSPNGRSVAFGVESGADADVWIYDFEGGAASRRLTAGGLNRYPVWSPDGQRVAFQSDRDGSPSIFSQKADGTGTAERLTKADPGTVQVPNSWSPDGKQLLFGIGKGDRRSLWFYDFVDGKSEKVGQIESNAWPNAVFSPDGRWIAYVMSASPSSSRLFVQPFPPTGATYLISRPEAAGNNPFWSPDGRRLFYGRGPGDYAVATIATTPTFTVGVATSVPAGNRVAQGQQREYDIMPDGKRLVIVNAGSETSLRAINVVLNWFEELNARVPRSR